ncbi:MAG TPA: hypothetical protein VFA44_04610 [Gaiellaceae bacterium]|nr:hypothetical protein [Gaiellaceae bacterium]
MPGPLVARWLSWIFDEPRAGALGRARVEVENAGSATWAEDVSCSYHWLDPRGNAIVWDGVRTPLRRRVPPGERVTLEVRIRAPVPPGRYRLALDLVAEHRAWFGEVGAPGPDEELDVLPRVQAEALADVADVHLPPGWELSPGSEQLALAAHAEGYAVVAGSVEAPRRLRRALAPWAGSPGRNPAFAEALLCPSVLRGVEVERVGAVEGLPAFAAPRDEPWIFDGRVVVRPAR